MTCSVAMTTYNGVKVVIDQLKSIEMQTRKPDEVVICDDVSKDETVEVVRRYAAESALNIRIYQNDKNLGYPKNFEKAISLCKGDVVFLCDQDDVWNVNKLQRMVTEFEQDEDLVFLFSDARVVNAELEVWANSLWKLGWTGESHKWSRLNNQQFFDLFISNHYPLGCLTAARKAFLHQIIPFATHHDRWIAYCAPLFGNIKAIDDTLIDYRRHSGNTTSTVTISAEKNNGIIKRVFSRFSAASKEVLKSDYEMHFVYPTSAYEVFQKMAKFINRSEDTLDTTWLQNRQTYLQMISEAKNRGIIFRLKTIRKLKKDGLYTRFRGKSPNLYRIDVVFLIVNAMKRKKQR